MFKNLIYIFIIAMISYTPSLNQTVWTKVNPYYGDYTRFHSVRCFDSLNCICLVNNADECCERVIKTTDGGKTWFSLYHEKRYRDENGKLITPEPVDMENASYLSENEILISRGKGFLFKSRDGGKSFDTIKIAGAGPGSHPDAPLLKYMHMYDNKHGAITNNRSIYITNDFWDTFKEVKIIHPEIPDDYVTYVNHIFMTDIGKFTAYAFSRKQIGQTSWHTLFKGFMTTTDNGKTWHMHDILKDSSEISSTIIHSLFFINSKIGWAVGDIVFNIPTGKSPELSLVYKTYDGGMSWKLIHTNDLEPRFGLWDIAFYDELNGITVGKYGLLLRTTDGGYTWFRDAILDGRIHMGRIAQQIAFAGSTPILSTFGDGLWRGTYTPSDIIHEPSGMNTSIYPNPATDYVVINPPLPKGESELASRGIYEIRIYNTLGQCVSHLTPTLSKGEGVRIDVSQLPVGVYLVRIFANNQIYYKKIMVLR